MRSFRLPFLLLVALAAALAGRAQSVRWDPPSGQLGFNQVSEISLVFEDCEPEGPPSLPTVAGLTFGRPSQKSEASWVNFKQSSRFLLIYPVRPTTRATLTLPPFSVETDKGTMRVAAATFTVGDATVGGTGVALADIASANLKVPKTTVWAGEVFPVTYELSVIRRYYHSVASTLDWPSAPLVAEEWSKPEAAEALVRGERRIVATQSTRATAKTPGPVRLPAAQQVLNLYAGTVGIGLFAQQTVEQRILATERFDLTVKPLPPAPADFTGAVGRFTLVSKVVPTAPAVGEPVTWTLELAGEGNWPDLAGLPAREVSKDFSVVQPQSKRAMKDNSLFEGTLTEDVVLVPTKTGRYTLAPVKFTYFDPAAGAYRTLTTEAATITVGAAPAPGPAPVGAPVQFSLPPAPGPATPVAPEPVAPLPPEHLPRDPQSAPAPGIAPVDREALAWSAAALVAVLPLLAWLVLAALRSRALDPERRRREARAALTTLLAELRAGGAPRAAQLRAWQGHVAALWEVPHAAPAAPRVQAAVARRAPAAAAAWTALWEEADRAQHARDGRLPDDWLLRAEGALRATTVPRWPVLSLFAPRHLLPFLVLALALLPAAGLRGADGAEAYRRGDFRAAEKAWRDALAAAPHDAAARHNLGLALAQQDRWAEATGHWTAGFLLAPRDPAVRADLALGLQRSGIAPPELVEFSRGEGPKALARAASPGEWQLVIAGSALLLAGALVLLLFQAYGRTGPWARPAALAVVLVAILAAGAGTLALRTYGVLAHPGAVFVWQPTTLRSIPTEADTQKATALSAGSLAVADRTFLGWTRLEFPGGQTGWVRTADLVRLYR